MATIYRFIIEQKATKSGDGRIPRDPTANKKGAAKKGRNVSIFGGEKGGVEHNRKLRAINPLLNKATGGVWEKGMRLGRAAAGLIQVDKTTGKFAGFSGTSLAIIIAFVLQLLMKWQQREVVKANTFNHQNFKQLENGFSQITGSYRISVNYFNGRYTYRENK